MTDVTAPARERSGAKSVVASTVDEDERLRGAIREELARQHALPVARRTLELLVEAGVEAAEGSPGYRVVDRQGQTRLSDPPEETSAKSRKPPPPRRPLTLGDLVAETRARHPDLFGVPPEPKPVPPPPAPDARPNETVAQVKAAGARFVETQSALARTLATSSAERSRAFAAAATQAVGGWRTRLDRHRAQTAKADAAPSPAERTEADAVSRASPPVAAPAPQPRSGFARDVGASLLRAGTRTRERFQRAGADRAAGIESGDARRRAVMLGLGAATALTLLVAGLVTTTRWRSEPGSPRTTTARQAPAAPQGPQANPSASAAVPTPSSPAQTDSELQPSSEDMPRNPSEIAGVPEVIDTATLRVSGKLLRLFGVEWVRGGQAEELTKYLAGRSVSCQPAPGSDAYLCTVNGRDLSEVVVFNGGGRASPEATPALAAAEDHARSERLGVWKR